MNIYGKEIKLECCYDFLCSNMEDNINEIRKKFFYYQNFAEKYIYTIYNYHKDDDISDWDLYNQQKREDMKLDTMLKLTYDSYLAILLHKLGEEKFKNIIYGLCSYFECSDAKVIAPLKELIEIDKTEFNLTKEQYLNDLKEQQHGSTNAGVYLLTPSLGSIIEIENELLRPNEEVKVLRKEKLSRYGELNLFDTKNK